MPAALSGECPSPSFLPFLSHLPFHIVAAAAAVASLSYGRFASRILEKKGTNVQQRRLSVQTLWSVQSGRQAGLEGIGGGDKK